MRRQASATEARLRCAGIRPCGRQSRRGPASSHADDRSVPAQLLAHSVEYRIALPPLAAVTRLAQPNAVRTGGSHCAAGPIVADAEALVSHATGPRRSWVTNAAKRCQRRPDGLSRRGAAVARLQVGSPVASRPAPFVLTRSGDVLIRLFCGHSACTSKWPNPVRASEAS